MTVPPTDIDSTTTPAGHAAAELRGVPASGPAVTQIARAHAVAELAHARFDRALERLQEADPRARVALDSKTGLAVGVDGAVHMEMPAAARALPGSDRAAAAAVLFLDEFGPLFGIAGWHVLTPRNASPLGRSIWFAFDAQTPEGLLTAHVCADEDTVKHARIERSAANRPAETAAGAARPAAADDL